MIRFEVTGETPEEFAENAMKAWGLLAIGLQNAMIGAKIATQVEAAVRGTTPTQTCGSESSSTASKEVEPASQSGSPPKNPKVHSDPVNDLFVPETESPASGSMTDPQPAKNSKPSSKAKGPKLDDLKTRLSEVIVAATERWDQKRANAYARKLLNELGIQKVSELKSEDYPLFMRLSDGYLYGETAE